MCTARCLIALLCVAQVIGQLQAAPNARKLFSTTYETTTAVAPHNASSSIRSKHTPTGTTSMPTVAMTTSNKHATKIATDSGTVVEAELTTKAASSAIPGTSDTRSFSSQSGTGKRYFQTTTAVPPYTGPVPSYRQFDALSFLGGALLTICLAIIGTMSWKMYIAHVERRYWTL